MGLASQLAAQGGAPQAPQQQYQQQAQQPQQQGWLGAPPAGGGVAPQPYGAPQPYAAPAQPYGTPAAPAQYGAAPQAGMGSVIAAKLAKIVAANQLQAFYPPDKLQAVAARVSGAVDFHALAARCVVNMGGFGSLFNILFRLWISPGPDSTFLPACIVLFMHFCSCVVANLHLPVHACLCV